MAVMDLWLYHREQTLIRYEKVFWVSTCLLSRKLVKLGEPDMQDTAGEAETSS